MPDPYRESTTEKSVEAAPAPPLSPVHQEILELERQLAEKKAALERPEIQESAPVQEQEKTFTQVQTQIQAAPAAASSALPPEVESLKRIEKNQQLKGLIDLAFQKGVVYATEVARGLDNPYLVDEFHDTLIDEFRKKLVDSGKLEEI